MLNLYWEVGKVVDSRLREDGWGKSTVDYLSRDISNTYPGIVGFSVSNLYRMRTYYAEYHKDVNLATVSREIGWSQNYTIFEKVKDPKEREFYMKLVQTKGFSVRRVQEEIANKAYKNYLEFQNNFDTTIIDPKRRAELAWQFKDDINLSLLGIQDEPLERELEEAIVKNIVSFLSDLGKDILFAGRQYPILIEGDEVRIDIVLYHRVLKSFIAVELKVTDFTFQDAGQIGGYLQAIDNQIKREDENPSIGIIICRGKNRTKVEYALKATNQPIGVITYSFNDLPKELSKYLPSEDDISNALIDIEGVSRPNL